jgi:molybdopterin-containing oxidoreductase family iron-sulfur binding subunit
MENNLNLPPQPAENEPMLDLAAIRQKLDGKHGREYWRSLDEVAETPEFQAWVEDEFPNRSSLMDVNRRSFLKFMGASMMLAGLGGCRSLFLPTEKVVPYVKMPEDMIPGKPMYFASAAVHNGTTLGILVESHEGRPTKIEGNPGHPASMGSTDYFTQAALIDMYDPDRLRGITHMGDVSDWSLFFSAGREALEGQRASGGEGLRILTETLVSPTESRLISSLLKQFPKAKWVHWDAVGNDTLRQGAQMAFGSQVNTTYYLDKAKVILSLDADFLHSMPDSVRMARDWAARRRVNGTDVSNLSRVYAVEAGVSPTGAMADHRLAVKPEAVELFARALAQKLGVTVEAPADSSIPLAWVDAVATDLRSAGGEGVVIPGQFASAATHALCHAINAVLGSVGEGKPLRYTTPYGTGPVGQVDLAAEGANSQFASLRSLAAEGDRVEMLLILGGNPVFDAPADLKIGEMIKRVPVSIHHTLHANETSAVCKWALGSSHFLESWGDARGFDGTCALIQPLIAPLHDTKSKIELLSMLQSGEMRALEIVRETWRERAPQDFDKAWTTWLNTGVVDLPAMTEFRNPALVGSVNYGPAPTVPATSVVFRPDATVWDGRFANNSWLQELPKVMTTLTWDNAAHISPKMAESLGVRNREHLKITVNGATVEMPALIVVGQPEGTVTLPMGYGRTEVGTVGAKTGFNVYPLRTSKALWSSAGEVVKGAGQTRLALTQTHHSMEGRDLLKMATVAEYLANPKLPNEGDKIAEKGLTMFPENSKEWPFEGAQWGMSIDLNVCTGCHACVTACQAENNIPVVGKDQVDKGREMHWIRIDRYYRAVKGSTANKNRDVKDPGDGLGDVLDSNNIETVFSPLACMHCEKAPCEPVCPVAATVHSHEGLNQMVYNRCVGTRYCSNNCPYKVRRFNFLNYTDNTPQFSDRTEAFNGVVSADKTKGRALLKMINNPNVTVRGRGVMEKCTYCVQRLNEVRIEAKKRGESIADGAAVTACQQACPTQAIVFGNIADPKSKVSAAKKEARNYSILPELNTFNRTTYLARLRNPNPEMEKV